MRFPLRDFSHHLKLLLAQFRHTAGRTIAPRDGLGMSGPQVSLLEQRLMMSASPAAVVAAPDAVEVGSATPSVDQILDEVFLADAVVEAQASDNDYSNSPQSSAVSQRELVVIDSTILQPESWIAELRQDSFTEFDVLILSEKQDGFDEITESLDGRFEYSAIHLVSHGAEGQISLGQATLDLGNLSQYESQLSGWKSSLAADADVLIYGCELAASQDGQQLVRSLAEILDADVAASDDLTGHQSLSGDWDLEYHSGSIQATIAFSQAYTETWVGVLPANAAPVNSVPDGQVILQDRILSFNDASGTTISVGDSDVGANDLQVTLVASSGTFTITDVGTAEYQTGDGFEDSTLVIEGTAAELNTALQNLHYTASTGFLGAAEITITTDDLGNGGAETPEQDTDVISVFVHDEFSNGGYTVAASGVDELNRHAHRGVSRSLAAGPNGDLISVWRTATDDVYFAIHDKTDSLVATGQINDAGMAATDIAVASGSDGSFVVAWSQDSGTDADVFAQRFSATGVSVGSRITVDNSAGTQQAVTIDRNAAGDFAVAWESTSGGINVRRFAADGSAIDGGSLSPTGGTGGTNASIGIDRDRNLLIGWDDSSGQYVQHYSGGAWGTKHTLSTLTFASGSAIGMTEDGQSVIAWHEQGANWKIRYQRIASDGSLNGAQNSAASVPSGDELNPSVAMDEEGNFVIAWETNGNIQARQFGSDGSNISSDIDIAASGQFENNAAVAVLDVDNFAVMYTSQSATADVYVSRFTQAATDSADPVIELVARTVGAANTTITERFMVGDDNTDATALGFGFTSSNPGLIGLGDLSVVGSGLYRDLVINPTADMIGSSEVTMTVTDSEGNPTSTTINVFVASPFITVTTTQDELDGDTSSILNLIADPGGTGISLREAITAANNTPDYGRRDRIHFDLGGGGQQTLSLSSELPVITESVFIDGQTQAGYASDPLIGLNGNLITGNGLTIEANDVVVRGMAIFGFQQSGIDLDTGNGILIRNADDARIYSNYIGVDQTGLTGDGNDRDGIRIIGQSHDNVIGGVSTARQNVISGNRANGVAILGDSMTPSATNEISYNFIGVGQDGTTDVGNHFVGVNLRNAYQTNILNNVISGNNDSGIELTGGATTETKIQGNSIGVAADGTTALGNDGDGIALYTSVGQGPAQTQIGGVESGEANIIANNSFIGVRLDSGGGVGNSIRGNQIYNNAAGLGIDLLGVASNDPGDADGGTNGQQNTPVLTDAEISSGDLTIQGTLNSIANTVFDIDVYSSVVADPDGAGEAETFLGTFSLTTNGSGNATFSEVIAGAATSVGHFITLTATDSGGSTSEFSQNQVVAGLPPTNSAPTVALSNATVNVDENTDTSSGLKIADIVVTDDGNGTNTLSLGGADAASFEIVGAELRLRNDVVLDYEQQTSLSVEVRVDDADLPGSPEDTASHTLVINDLADTIPAEAFWFNTVADVSGASGATGDADWGNSEVMVLGDPNLSVGSGTTMGHIGSAFDLEDFVQDGNTSISGMHVVSRDITVGTSTSVALQAGDILFSTSSGETFNEGTLTTTARDVVLFEPDTAGDYSSGTFSILLDGLGGSNGLEFLSAFTLVEESTTIGDTVVDAGDFLFFSTASLGGKHIQVYDVDSVGEGTTSGAASRILDGNDLGISGLTAVITGLELVETSTTIGGQIFDSGTLLVVSNNAPSDLATSDNDVFALDVTQTEIGSGSTAASSSMVIRGDDIGLSWLSSLSLGNQAVEVTTLSAVADAYTSKGADTTNFGSSSSIIVDKSGGDLGDERGLFRFDLSSLPSDAVITSAQLVLNATALSAPFDINVYEVTESWDESSVTYDDRSTGLNWTTSGGTVDSTVLDTFSATTTGSHIWDITSLAAAWKDGSTDNNGVLLGTPDGGSEDVTYDSREGAVAPQLVITYTSAAVTNDPPIADIGGPYVINEGSDLNLDASGSTDPESDTLTYAWDLDNDGSFDDAAGVSPVVSWATLPAGIQDDGSYTIRVSVSDGSNPADIETTTLTIANVDPTGNSDSGVGFLTTEDAAFTTGNVITNDTDPAGGSDPLQVSAVNTTGTTGQVSIATGNTAFVYDPNGQFEHLRVGESATDTFSYTVADGDGGTSTNVTVTIVINGSNDQPTGLTLNNLTLTENAVGAVVGQLSTLDPDSTDTHTYTVDDARFEVVGSDLRLVAGQSVNYETEQSIDLEIVSTDIDGLQFTRTFTIAVGDENDVAPVVAGGQTFGVSESVSSGASVGTVSASDVDTVGSLQAYSIDSGDPTGVFTIDSATGEISVADHTLLDALTTPSYDLDVSVSDGITRSASVSVRINVSDVNTAPVASDDAFTLDEGATLTSNVGADWFNPSWKNRQQLSIDNSGIASSLTDYPLRLRFHASAPDAISIDYSKLQTDGSDLVFVDPDGTILAYEIEHWDPAGYSDVWVRVPVIDGAATDSITMYYNSSSANPSPTATSTWGATDAAVIHLNEDSVDSSGNTSAGNVYNSIAISGQIAGGAAFNGTNGEIRYTQESSINDIFDGGGTISAWINPSSLGENNYGRILDKAATTFAGGVTGAGWTLQLGPAGGAGELIFEMGFSDTAGRWRTPPGSISLSQWQHVAVVYDQSSAANDPKIYIDGVEQTVTETVAPVGTVLSDATNDLVIGNYSQASTRAFDGSIDEVRIRSTAVFDAELEAEYRDVESPVVTSAGVETGPGGVLSNDMDSDGDDLAVTLTSGPSNASAFNLQADGSFSYTHDGSETTSDSFTYQITDGVATSTATVTLSITPQNDQLPVITAGQTLSISESAAPGSNVGTVIATDGDPGSTFSSWSIVSGNGDGHFVINSTTGAIALSPGSNLDYETTQSYSLQVSVSDGVNTSVAETVTVELTDANDELPVITGGQVLSVSESVVTGTSVGTVVATDADTMGTLGAWSIIGGNAAGHFSINSTTGEIAVADTLDYETTQSYSLQVSVSDGVNTSVTETVTVQVTDANDELPVVTGGQVLSVSESVVTGTSVGTVVATDADTLGTLGAWSIVGGNAAGHFSINSTTGEISVADTLDYETTQSYSLQVTVSDGVNTSVTETVTVEVTDTNDELPVVNVNQSFHVAENAAAGTAIGTITATDADASTTLQDWQLTPGVDSGNFLLDSVTGELSLVAGHTLNFDDGRDYLLEVTVSDGLNRSVAETVRVVVTDVDLVPSLSAIADQAIPEDSTGTSIAISVSDPDTDVSTLVLTATSSNTATIQEAGLSFVGTGATRQLVVTPNAGVSSGTSVITVSASDGSQIVTQTFSVTVSPVNDAPVIAAVADQSLDEDDRLRVNLTVSDADNANSELTISAISSDTGLISASGLTFLGSPDAPVLRITPMENQFGSTTISVTVSDGIESTTETFHVTVNPVNDAPTISPTVVRLNVKGSALNISKSQMLTGVMDVDSSNLTLVLVTGPQNGSLIRNPDGQFVYTPTLGFTGVDSFTYVASDGELDSEVRRVKLKVAPSIPSLPTEGVSNSIVGSAVSERSSATATETVSGPQESEKASQASSETSSTDQLTPAARTPEQETDSGGNDQQEEEKDTIFVKEQSESGDLFVFRKVVAIDVADQSNVDAGGIRDDGIRDSGKSGLNSRVAPDTVDQFQLKFQQDDWQYYSDLTSTVKGVEEFQAHLKNDHSMLDLTTGTITFAGTSLVVGTVVTAIRSGMLALGFLSQLPVWTMFDPLMVVDGVAGEEGDSLEDIVDRQAKQQEQQDLHAT